LDIAPPVLRAAKRLAAEEGITLRELMGEGLRRATFLGNGLQPETRDAGSSRLRALSYEGRGA